MPKKRRRATRRSRPPLQIKGDVRSGRDVILGGQTNIGAIVIRPGPRSAIHIPVAPRPDPAFTGRAAELSALKLILSERQGCVLWGLGGVGKTHLARKFASQFAADYPDGQFEIDLLGTFSTPLAPTRVMFHVLRAFEPDFKGALSDAEMAERYLALLHGRRVLLILDNARNAQQMEPLLPPESCKLIITSRQRIIIPGYSLLGVQGLKPDEARAYVRELTKQPDAVADQIAELCGGLPLTLKTFGCTLAGRRDRSVQAQLAELADARKRLRRTAMDASLVVSERLLPARVRRCWHMLALFPIPFTQAWAGRLWGLDADATDEILGALLNYSLIESDQEDRYSVHDLVRLFLSERLKQAGPARAERNLAAALADGRQRYERAALADRRQRYERAAFLGECLLGQPAASERLHRAVRGALVEMMTDSQMDISERRTAAFRLTRLRWLSAFEPDELAVCLSLIMRYVSHPENLAYLARTITQMLRRDLSDPHRAQLLIYRAVLNGALGARGKAEKDYLAALPLAAQSNRLTAQVKLGLGIITARRARALPPKAGQRGPLFQQAIESYREAERLAAADGQDTILRVTVCGQLSYTWAEIGQPAEAERWYAAARRILRQNRRQVHPDEYAHYDVWLLEQAGLIYKLKAEGLQARSQKREARQAYEQAYQLALKEIKALGSHQSEALIVACLNAGEYVWGLRGGRTSPKHAQLACRYWVAAREMSHHLRLSDYEEEAVQLLKHCPDGRG